MSINFNANGLNTVELMMYHCGYEACSSGHSFGPAVRDHFLVHYILSGKGKFYMGDKIYSLEKGQGFLICPDTITFYEADVADPWTYYWVGFHGLKALHYLETAQLTQIAPVFTAPHHDYIAHCFESMLRTQELKYGSELRLLGLLYGFLSELIEIGSTSLTQLKKDNQSQEYIQMAVRYIEMNFSRQITVMDISRHLGLDRSYLCHLFKKILSKSPQKFLIDYRMNKAIELMHNPFLSLGDISRSIGYKDSLSFSKTFSKTKGMAPSTYQKNLYK